MLCRTTALSVNALHALKLEVGCDSALHAVGCKIGIEGPKLAAGRLNVACNAGDVIATYHYREAEIEKAPAIVGETALLAGSEGQYSVRPCGYRSVLHHLLCSFVDVAAMT